MDTTAFHLFLATIVLATGSLYILARVRKLWSIAILDIAIWMCGVYFGFGPWLAFMYSDFTLPIISAETLVWTYLSILLFMAGLMVVRWKTSRDEVATDLGGNYQILGRVSEIIRRAVQVPMHVIFLALVFVIATRLLLIKYGVLFSGTRDLQSMVALPYPVVVMLSMSSLMAAGLLIWSSAAMVTQPQKRLLAIAVLSVEFLFLWTQGRRMILLFAITVGVTYLIMRGRLLMRHIIVSGIVVYVLWTVFLPAFYIVRISLLSRTQTGNVLVDIMEGITDFRGMQEEDRGMRNYQKNLGSRPLIINFNINIVESQKFVPLMWGKATLNSILSSIPRVILPLASKPEASEATIQRHYGLRLGDTADNWPALAVADFGVAGAFVYGFFIGGVIAFMEWCAVKLSPRMPFVAICFIGVMLKLAFMVEYGPEAFWGELRDCMLLLTIATCVSVVLPRPSQNEAFEVIHSPGS